MPRFGVHVSIADGLHLALERGRAISCETIQIFTRNSNRWQSKARTPEELEIYRTRLSEVAIDPVVAHAIYLINLASPDPTIHGRSVAAFAEELARCHEAEIPYLVIHPGSHRGSGVEEGIARIAAAINRAYEAHPEYRVVTLLENCAGMGDTIGRSFEELAATAAQVQEPARVGYCFDTAHALASGYEIRTPEGYAATWAAFDALLGLERLRCFHLNDSKYDLGSARDEHEHIGQGYVGLEAFRMLVNDPRFADHAMLLETPKGPEMAEDIENLAQLRALIKK